MGGGPGESSVIASLRAALVADPGDDEIRRHLAGLLVQDGQADEALSHYQTALGSAPDDIGLLREAALAARLAGRDDRAASYERLVSALGGSAPPPAPPAQAPIERSGEGDDGIPHMTLADVGGMADVKARLQATFLEPARHPELREFYGTALSGGLLLYGPPGCGKTHIARALAGELGARFHLVGLTDVLDMWLGEPERRLHELFETARRRTPALIFLDEIDALGRKRSQMTHSGGRTLVNQLLTEMDGVAADNAGIFVLGATNHPWDVDTALRRPGRFDRMVLVLPPDAAARTEILALHLSARPTNDLDLPGLAARLDGFTGADLAHVVETATEFAMHDAMTTGRRRPIVQEDLVRAAREIRPSSWAWFEIAHNVALFADEGGQYDDLLTYMREHHLT